jgi:hypothetical protein
MPAQLVVAAWQVAITPLASLSLLSQRVDSLGSVPCKDNQRSPDVRRHDLPHHVLKFKENVGDLGRRYQ